ncbi:unnamed protein product, partial [Urochloa humidicola]
PLVADLDVSMGDSLGRQRDGARPPMASQAADGGEAARWSRFQVGAKARRRRQAVAPGRRPPVAPTTRQGAEKRADVGWTGHDHLTPPDARRPDTLTGMRGAELDARWGAAKTAAPVADLGGGGR